MRRLLNKKFRYNPGHYFLQCLLIMIFMVLVLFPLGSLESNVFTAIGASTLASSIIIMFATPNAPVSAIYRVIGGYTIGILVGMFWHLMLAIFEQHILIDHTLATDITGALAVGFVMIIMALFDLIHPPSAGFSLAIVIGPWNRWTICVVIVAVLILCVIKYLLRNWFIKLI